MKIRSKTDAKGESGFVFGKDDYVNLSDFLSSGDEEDSEEEGEGDIDELMALFSMDGDSGWDEEMVTSRKRSKKNKGGRGMKSRKRMGRKGKEKERRN